MMPPWPNRGPFNTRKKLPMSLTKLIAVAAVLSMFAVAADARPRHHHHRHHRHHHARVVHR
jgi:hypothetical protein